MSGPVVVEVRSAAVAASVADAIAPFGARVARRSEGWTFEAPLARAAELHAALSAVRRCLDEHGIPSVVVGIDGSRYVLRPH